MKSEEGVVAYRSKSALITGGLLLAVALWMLIDTAVRGEGRTIAITVTVLLFAAVLVVALTFRGAVFAGPRELVVRNPFRTVTVPWGEIEEIRSEYSVEVRTRAAGSFHLWAVPVSLRERKRAARGAARSMAESPFGGVREAPGLAFADRVTADLKGMTDQFAKSSTGEVRVRWSWEVIGALLLTAAAAAVAITV